MLGSLNPFKYATNTTWPSTVALALREQILTSEIVPMAEHDWSMDYIVGPDGVISQGDV